MATSGPSFTVRCQIAVYLSVNDQLLKGGVRTCPPFEYHPGWKVFLTMLSDEISLSKRLVLG